MHRHLLSFIGLTLLSGAAIAAPGESTSTQSEQPDRPPAVQPSTGQTSASATGMEQSSQAQLVAADELIGRDVTTQEGERLGTLQYVTVNLDRGNVSHLIIDTSGTSFSTSQTTSGTEAAPATQGQPSTPEQSQPSIPEQSPGQATGHGDTAGQTQSTDRPPSETIGEDPADQRAPEQQRSMAQQGEGELVIVPWGAVNVDDQSESIVIAATGHHIANAPRLHQEELNRLTEPTLASYVVDYWAPVSEMAALEGRRETQSESQQSQSESQQIPGQQPSDTEQSTEEQQPFQSQDPQSQRPDQAGVSGQSGASSTADVDEDPSGQDVQPGQDVVRHGEQATTDDPTEEPGAVTGEPETAPIGEVAQPSPTSPTESQPQSSGSESGERMVLIGQQVVATVTPPMFQLSSDLRGAEVLDQSGETVGEIRQIMIDTNSGAAAFAVVEGTSAGRAPVPLQALEWTAEGTTLLNADASSLQSDQALTENPEQVSRSQIADLYQRFGAEPYWEQSGSEDSTSGSPSQEWPQ